MTKRCGLWWRVDLQAPGLYDTRDPNIGPADDDVDASQGFSPSAEIAMYDTGGDMLTAGIKRVSSASLGPEDDEFLWAASNSTKPSPRSPRLGTLAGSDALFAEDALDLARPKEGYIMVAEHL